MLVKWIDCTVPRHKRDAFSRGQARWRAVAEVDGFIAQFGGWCAGDAARAVILGCWRDERAYHAFINDHHDAILRDADQVGTWSSIRVSIWRVLSDSREAASRIAAAAHSCGTVRLTRYTNDMDAVYSRLAPSIICENAVERGQSLEITIDPHDGAADAPHGVLAAESILIEIVRDWVASPGDPKPSTDAT